MSGQLLVGDARKLCRGIPDGSIDLIFTDPPYNREALPLYGWLAEEAARVLTPSGFLLSYCGGAWKPEIMQMFGKHLLYFWDFVTLDGRSTILWAYKINAGYKSILAYRKGNGKPRLVTQSVWKGSGRDKTFHTWGQDESTARYYIECFTEPGDLVLDPFCGGGTTCYVCAQLGRRWLAFDIDPVAIETTRERLKHVQMPLLQEQSVNSRMDLTEQAV